MNILGFFLKENLLNKSYATCLYYLSCVFPTYITKKGTAHFKQPTVLFWWNWRIQSTVETLTAFSPVHTQKKQKQQHTSFSAADHSVRAFKTLLLSFSYFSLGWNPVLSSCMLCGPLAGRSCVIPAPAAELTVCAHPRLWPCGCKHASPSGYWTSDMGPFKHLLLCLLACCSDRHWEETTGGVVVHYIGTELGHRKAWWTG